MPAETLSLLVVEDNDADFRLVMEYLKESPAISFKVSRAKRVSDALALIEKKDFDAALLDLNLPDSRGLSIIEKLGARAPGTAMLVLTGMDDETVGIEAVKIGAQDYLVKGRMSGDLLHRSIRYAMQRKRAEKELKDLNASLAERVAERTAQLEQRAAQLQRLTLELTNAEDRERERIAAILHDDLQQQLAALKIKASMILAGRKQPQTAARLAEFTRMIDDCIGKTRILSHELVPPAPKLGGIGATLHWLAEDVKGKFGLDITVQGDAMARVKTPMHASTLVRAVRELLFNVHKHSGVRSAVVRVSSANDEVRVSVEDRGAGFDPAKLHRDGGADVGLGLFGILERISLLGGRVEIDAVPGKGCCVSLFMPGVEPVAAMPAAKPAARRPTGPVKDEASGGIRVLLADDRAVVREGLASLLKSAGFQVVGQAANGEEAVELAAQLAPDVILMDVSMPGMDGIEATAKIMARSSDVRIIGLSMHEDPAISARMLQAGAWCYLPKAGPSATLFDAIRGRHPLDPA